MTRRRRVGGFARKPMIVQELLAWAEERKRLETANRPEGNVHKRVLAATWNQVITKLRACRG